MNGNNIIRIGIAIWVTILSATLFINNEYINALLIFFGALLTICIFAIGCEKLEKNKEPFKVAKWIFDRL